MTDYKKEFEEFAYIVSHDLNAPFRHIREFSKLLVHRLEEKLGEDEKTYLQYIENGVQKVEDMLEVLLKLSRLNTQVKEFGAHDCNAIVARVLKKQEMLELVGKVELEIADLPEDLYGDDYQFSVLFEAVIDNALRYRGKDSNAHHVRIECREDKTHYHFIVGDTGIGVEDRHKENVFLMFKRLDPNGEEGIGAGLTLAKNVVERHGGEIWLEDTEGSGLSVHFTIQKKQPS